MIEGYKKLYSPSIANPKKTHSSNAMFVNSNANVLRFLSFSKYNILSPVILLRIGVQMDNTKLDIDIYSIRKAQEIAKYCLDSIAPSLKSGLSRQEIHSLCEELMLSKGSTGWWTHDDAALILYGPYLTYSAHEDPGSLFDGLMVAENDVITIDVAPMFGNGWGDMARTFVIENGVCIPWHESHNQEIIDGMNLELELHQTICNYINKDTTFSDLHKITDSIIEEKGYINCDYHGNFGHTIEIFLKNRVTIIPEENRKISDYGKPFTYEPHICKSDGTIGIKYENMYLLAGDHLQII